MRIPDQYNRDQWKYNSRELPKWDRENGCLGEDGAKTFQDLKRAYMKKHQYFYSPLPLLTQVMCFPINSLLATHLF